MIKPEDIREKQKSLVPNGLYDIIDQLIILNFSEKNSTAAVYLSDLNKKIDGELEVDSRVIGFAIKSYDKAWCIENITDEGELIGYLFKVPKEL